MENLEKEVKLNMRDAVEHLRQELKNLRTGRANPAILDSVQIEVYGSQMRLRDVANVTTPEPRQLLITPYDASNVNAIAKSIEAANLGFMAVVDASVVRINVPSMDESMRKDIVKQCKKKGEETKVAIREVRRKHNEIVRKEKQDGTIPEDIMKKSEKKIQDLTDTFCKEVDNLCNEKEKEILTI